MGHRAGWPRAVGLCAALALLLPACAGTPEAPPAGGPGAVRAAVERIVAADNARDLAGVLAAYTDDIVWLPPNGDMLRGRAALRARYEPLFAGFQPHMAVEVVDARSSGVMGFAWGYVKGSLTPVEGGDAVPVDDKFLAVVRHEDGEWRVARLMWGPREDEP